MKKDNFANIFRHKLYYASLNMRPGCRAVITDACVPISRLPEIIIETRKDVDEMGIIGIGYFIKWKS